MAVMSCSRVFEDAAAKLVLGQVTKEALNHIEPTGRGWGEMDMEALVTVHPADDLLVCMRGIVIADQADMFFLVDGLIDQAEKLQPLLMPASFLAEAQDLAVEGVRGLILNSSLICLGCLPSAVSSTIRLRNANLTSSVRLKLRLTPTLRIQNVESHTSRKARGMWGAPQLWKEKALRIEFSRRL